MRRTVAFLFVCLALVAGAFEKPKTTRRYLQGPLSERLLVFFREGKITFGECVHRDAWKDVPYREQPAHGVWLVRGEADEPFDPAEAVLRTLTWDVNEKCPATILRRSDNAILYLEPASAAKLQG